MQDKAGIIKQLRRENRTLARKLRERDAVTLSDEQASILSDEIIAVADGGYAALKESGVPAFSYRKNLNGDVNLLTLVMIIIDSKK